MPPHLRNSQSSGGNSGPRESGGGRGGGGGQDSDRRGSYNDNRRGSYGDDRRGGYGGHGGGGPRGSYQDGGGGGGGEVERAPTTNSRWSNAGDGDGGRYGGDDDRRGSYGGRGGGGGGGGGGYDRRASSYEHKNERGFHGDTAPDPRLERTLFGGDDKQTTGINFDNYDKIPVEVSGEGCPDPIDVYTPETVGEDLFRNTQLCGYAKPTPVQKYSIPIGAADRDLMACAQTGSGKTAGFLFPIIMAMLKNGGRDPPDSTRRRIYPEALIMAPTRELAQQIHDEARRFCYRTGIASVCIYGGAEVRDQLRQIERGCDLLVATPGRLVDLIERGRLGMENVRFLVLDEADR